MIVDFQEQAYGGDLVPFTKVFRINMIRVVLIFFAWLTGAAARSVELCVSNWPVRICATLFIEIFSLMAELAQLMSSNVFLDPESRSVLKTISAGQIIDRTRIMGVIVLFGAQNSRKEADEQ